MDDSFATLTTRAEEYVKDRDIKIESQLGFGQDGIVYATDRRTAVKAYGFERGYATERDIYIRFSEENVSEIASFAVPWLIDFDDSLMVVEMTFVNPPFVLDFAKCYLADGQTFPPK